jgi:hypothetical protein
MHELPTMPSMNAIRLVGFGCAACLGLMLGLVCAGGAISLAALLIGAGGALTLGVCAWAEWQ